MSSEYYILLSTNGEVAISHYGNVKFIVIRLPAYFEAIEVLIRKEEILYIRNVEGIILSLDLRDKDLLQLADHKIGRLPYINLMNKGREFYIDQNKRDYIKIHSFT